MVTAMSSGKSDGTHSGPYGEAVMTSFCWFSGNSAPSRKCMVVSFRWMNCEMPCSVRQVALDAGTLHLPVARRVVHDRVMLRRAIVPKRDAVRPPAPAHPIFRYLRLADQVLQQLRRTRRIVLPAPHSCRRMKIGEVRREAIHEED